MTLCHFIRHTRQYNNNAKHIHIFRMIMFYFLINTVYYYAFYLCIIIHASTLYIIYKFSLKIVMHISLFLPTVLKRVNVKTVLHSSQICTLIAHQGQIKFIGLN